LPIPRLQKLFRKLRHRETMRACVGMQDLYVLEGNSLGFQRAVTLEIGEVGYRYRRWALP
jgi:hypothetical protein